MEQLFSLLRHKLFVRINPWSPKATKEHQSYHVVTLGNIRSYLIIKIMKLIRTNVAISMVIILGLEYLSLPIKPT
jgi:hypothetical protein